MAWFASKEFRPGHSMGYRDWGVVAKCPHCERTDIKRTSKVQKICGADACKLAAQRIRWRASQVSA